MRTLLLRCYPARWRARYEVEFRAVLDERTLGPCDLVDVLVGAVDAQLQGRWTGLTTGRAGAHALAARVGGIAAIIGAPLWTAGFALANDQGMVALGGLGTAAGTMLVGSLIMLIALCGLCAVQASTRPLLAWSSFALPAAGAVAMAIGSVIAVIDGTPPETLFLGLLSFFVGSLLFGLVAVHVGVLPRAAAALLVAAPIVTLAGGDGGGAAETLIVGGLIVFDAGWVGLGALTILRSRPSAMGRIA